MTSTWSRQARTASLYWVVQDVYTAQNYTQHKHLGLLIAISKFIQRLQVQPASSLALIKTRVARCPVFNRTVRYFGSLSCMKMIVIQDNAFVNGSIFSATETGIASVRYFGESHQSWQP